MKAFIGFKQVGQYAPQFSTPVLHPAVTNDRFDVEKGWLHCLRGQIIPTTKVKPVEIEGGWDAKRFSFVLQVDNTSRMGAHRRTFLFGYTEPCEELTDETKLYFTRLNEVGSFESMTKDGPVTHTRHLRDMVIFPQMKGWTADEKLFNGKVSSVFQRIGTECVFGQHLRASGDTAVTNMTGVIHKHTATAVPVSELTAEGWVADVAKAVTYAGGQGVDTYEGEEELIFQFAADCAPDSTPYLTDIYNELVNKTNLGYEGAITLGELKSLMEDPTCVSIEPPRVQSVVDTPDPSDEAKTIFDFYVKQALVEAHHDGLGHYRKTWSGREGVVMSTVNQTSRLVIGTEWVKPDDADPTDPLDNADALPAPENPLPAFYGVRDWTVEIKLDTDGDIVGHVTTGWGEDLVSTLFVRPAWAVAMTSGLAVTEQKMNDIGWVVKHLTSKTLEERGSIQRKY